MFYDGVALYVVYKARFPRTYDEIAQLARGAEMGYEGVSEVHSKDMDVHMADGNVCRGYICRRRGCQRRRVAGHGEWQARWNVSESVVVVCARPPTSVRRLPTWFSRDPK